MGRSFDRYSIRGRHLGKILAFSNGLAMHLLGELPAGQSNRVQ